MRPLGKEILIFLVLVFFFSLVPYALMIRTHHIGGGGGMVVRMVMWCPSAAALVTCWLRRIPIETLGWNWLPARYEAYGYLLPLVYAVPVYALTWILIRGSFALSTFERTIAASYGLPDWPQLTTFGLGLPLLATLGVIGSLTTALGEEIGWRGFLLPRLVQQFGFTLGCTVSGGIWAVWHYPGLLWADYNAGTYAPYALGCFTLMVIGMAFIMGWLRLKSGSLWPCAVLHASHNLFIQAILDRMTATVGRAPYVTTEFGFGLVLSVGAAGMYFWLRRKELAS